MTLNHILSSIPTGRYLKVAPEAQLREQLLEATRDLMLTQGYNGTSLDDICRASGATKGALYHHFRNKEELASAALTDFVDARMQATARVQEAGITDSLEKIHAYLEFAVEYALQQEVFSGCLLGNLSQELYQSHPGIMQQCEGHFEAWREFLTGAISEAKADHAPQAAWQPEAVAQHFIALFQGSIILAKAAGDATVFENNIRQFQRYIDTIFNTTEAGEKQT